jgi:hypothetical protein
VDIDWNPIAPGTLATLSEPPSGGSKLQMWRVSPVCAEQLREPAVGQFRGADATSTTQPQTAGKVGWRLPAAAVPKPTPTVSRKPSGGITAINAAIAILTEQDPVSGAWPVSCALRVLLMRAVRVEQRRAGVGGAAGRHREQVPEAVEAHIVI